MNSAGQKVNVAELLAQGQTVQFPPTGWSMYPLLVPGRDQVIVEPVDPAALRRGDVALYRRDQGILVLHRICRVRPEGFYLVGDNQKEVEGPLRPSQFLGRMAAVVRKGKTVSVRHPAYRALAGTWLALRPVRPALSKAAARVRRLFRPAR